MRTATVLTAAVVMVTALSAAPAVATSCAQTDPAAQLEHADAVFVGTPTTSAADEDTVVVAVTDVYKGEVPRSTPVVAEPDMGEPQQFEDGQQYVFFVQVDDGALVSGVCSGTGPVDDAVITALEAASSDRSAYRPAPSPQTPTRAAPTPVASTDGTGDAGDPVATSADTGDADAIPPVLVGVVIVALVALVLLVPGYLRRRGRKDSVGPTS